ncbi:MAG: ribonuclease Z [Flavobacteriaceae bacterium]
MIFSRTGNITVVTQERASIIELVANIEKKYDQIKHDNIIVNLFSVKEIEPSAINDFLLLSNKHTSTNKSFVVVTNKIDIDTVPEELTVVPTLQEAHDIIEMEEIERDLGI